MLVTLAYPYDGHAPDKTVEVDDVVGRGLIRDGLARVPDVRAPKETRQPVPPATPKE